MRDFYIHMSSNDSIKYYPESDSSNFTIHLPDEIELHGQWECALAEIDLPVNPRKDLIICCDIVESGVILGKKLPVLRRVFKKNKFTEFINRFYVPVIRSSFRTICIYVLSGTGEIVSFGDGRLSCAVHFKCIK
jgi:hypothetical protein